MSLRVLEDSLGAESPSSERPTRRCGCPPSGTVARSRADAGRRHEQGRARSSRRSRATGSAYRGNASPVQTPNPWCDRDRCRALQIGTHARASSAMQRNLPRPALALAGYARTANVAPRPVVSPYARRACRSSATRPSRLTPASANRTTGKLEAQHVVSLETEVLRAGRTRDVHEVVRQQRA
jgi:hypothetical protein